MKYKFLFIVAILFIYASSCDKDDPIEPFDHVLQAQKDNDSLVKFMQSHFLDDNDILQEITNGEDPFYGQVQTEIITLDLIDGTEINYTLYYYVTEEGVNDIPTRVDLANVSYKGESLGYNSDTEKLESAEFDHSNFGIWADLSGGVVKGWSYGIPHFISGDATELPDHSFEYSGTGKGIILFPSGLGYANNPTIAEVPPNSPLIFYVELNQVFRNDHDEDTILSMFESVDGDDDFQNDDTDDDGFPNFLDTDDDGDGTLTKDENPDPNGDGNPSDALDTDGDNIPDYLDPDNF
jgi:hypothetical protein